MTSKKNVLSAIAGLAMFALPASALAGHHHGWNHQPRPYAWHDQGWHRGWLKHHEQYAVRPIEDEDDEGENYHFRPRERPPAFLCDGDGDDCEPNRGEWGNDDYGPPLSYYQAGPPAGYNPVQQRNWLLERRRRAYYVLGLMRARHDSRAAQRISTVIRVLDARIARDNQLMGGGRYVSPSVPYYPAPSNQNYANYGYNPGHGYNPGYGYNPSSPSSPGLNALTSMVGPLLGLPTN